MPNLNQESNQQLSYLKSMPDLGNDKNRNQLVKVIQMAQGVYQEQSSHTKDTFRSLKTDRIMLNKEEDSLKQILSNKKRVTFFIPPRKKDIMVLSHNHQKLRAIRGEKVYDPKKVISTVYPTSLEEEE